MTADLLSTPAELESLEPEWEELWDTARPSHPFNSPYWLLPWVAHLFEGGVIRTIALRDGGRLIGLLPCFRWGTTVRTVSLLGAGISDYGDLLAAPGRERECAGAGWKLLMEMRPEWDVLDWRDVPGGSPLLVLANSQPCSVCPVLQLADYPAALDPKLRTDLRRARNRLARLHRPAFGRADTTSLDGHLEILFSLHQARWATRDETGVLTGARLQAFHAAAAGRFARAGRLRLHVLHIDGQAAAVLYGFAAGGTLFCYLTGLNPQFAKLSPGAVLLGHALEEAQAEGMTGADFLRDPEPYKYLWGARDERTYRLSL